MDDLVICSKASCCYYRDSESHRLCKVCRAYARLCYVRAYRPKGMELSERIERIKEAQRQYDAAWNECEDVLLRRGRPDARRLRKEADLAALAVEEQKAKLSLAHDPEFQAACDRYTAACLLEDVCQIPSTL